MSKFNLFFINHNFWYYHRVKKTNSVLFSLWYYSWIVHFSPSIHRTFHVDILSAALATPHINEQRQHGLVPAAISTWLSEQQHPRTTDAASAFLEHHSWERLSSDAMFCGRAAPRPSSWQGTLLLFPDGKTFPRKAIKNLNMNTQIVRCWDRFYLCV